ncbi:hypothetical protein [Carbonactinospora thermoautotrophica]|uniref:hypothetical protein n=1 Tax=Carbonactinospora thermoautotrophica TaxID=1469144 RepID=UPI0022708C1B|nr:hypothetical protein [Carbonactinospora thermoautotrophica]
MITSILGEGRHAAALQQLLATVRTLGTAVPLTAFDLVLPGEGAALLGDESPG